MTWYSGAGKSKTAWFILVALFLVIGALAGDDKTNGLSEGLARISAEKFLKDVRYLSTDEMRGRGNDSPELMKAAAYIRERFADAGLRPAFRDGYYQRLDVLTGADSGDKHTVDVTVAGVTDALKLREDYWPIGFGSRKEVQGEVVFCGYGITANEYHYDDYAGQDVAGKVVVVLDHEPQEKNPHSLFAGAELTRYATTIEKAVNAKMHGAAALLIVPDLDNHPGQDAGFTFREAEALGIPVARTRAEVAMPWFTRAGKNLVQIQRSLDETLHSQSFAFGGSARLYFDITPRHNQVVNVVGWIAGSDRALKDEYIVIGAHFDHIGLGARSSMSPQLTGQVHNGADDNASGTAALIQLARAFEGVRSQLKRSVVFVAFAGEELGLLGSSYYTKHAPFPIDRTVAMFNLDMVGRASSSVLYVGGTSTAAEWVPLLNGLIPASQLEVKFSGMDYGSSDHVSFDLARVPNLFFFSGLHSDYHKASDDWEKIDPRASEKIIRFAFQTAYELQRRPSKMAYIVRQAPQKPITSGSGSGYGPDFGSMPDFSQDLPGVRFAGVRPESPAAKAGLLTGDRLIVFAGKKIENLYDFTSALRAQKPGDEIDVEVVRGEETLKFKVLLTARK